MIDNITIVALILSSIPLIVLPLYLAYQIYLQEKQEKEEFLRMVIEHFEFRGDRV